ncbi:hypothetical protein BDP27DRAFT_1334871, partial [Rhodocollybia butyracea]
MCYRKGSGLSRRPSLLALLVLVIFKTHKPQCIHFIFSCAPVSPSSSIEHIFRRQYVSSQLLAGPYISKCLLPPIQALDI